MPLPPFTHHELLTLVEPFTQRGWQLDMAASDRIERRLVFVPRGLPAPQTTLRLDHGEPARIRLTRVHALAAGLQATVQAEGADAGALLAAIEAVPLQRQSLQAGGTVVALHQRLAPPMPAGAGPVLVLQRAEAHFGGLTLQMVVSGVSGFPAELELLRGDGAVQDLPDDLLAVLGRPWHRLSAIGRGWLGGINLQGSEPQRTRDAQARLQRTVEHLVQTLREPPARFHLRHRGRRWVVALRGTLPLVAGAAIVVTALLMKREGSALAISVLGLMANIAPPLLLGLLFLRREMPRLALPRWPRPPAATAWRSVAP
jgi:hypothetical protein